jgi:hypothetical protein
MTQCNTDEIFLMYDPNHSQCFKHLDKKLNIFRCFVLFSLCYRESGVLSGLDKEERE